jgi:predicted nucleic-acid-binding Zn-ribbon protein
MKTYKCNKCGYVWISRIENPVCCPRCKRYDFQKAPIVIKKAIFDIGDGEVIIEEKKEEIKEEIPQSITL